MDALQARDLMTTPVVTVPPDMAVEAIARLLARRGITAAPVVDGDGALLGLVTAADLTCRLSEPPAAEPSWLRWLLADPSKAAIRYARAHGFVARDVMSLEIDTIPPDLPAAGIASLLESKGIRRVLVTERGRLRGIVSRSDLLHAVTGERVEPTDLPDARIRTAILAAMRRESWADLFHTQVEVHDGVVEFHGFAPGREVQRALRVLAEHVPGVKGVRDLTEPVLPLEQVML
ncbi:CBS domain-containing protein [Neoroseomonas marina]|nr:CBS domain-containing protein [Neoroseomonas marina]